MDVAEADLDGLVMLPETVVRRELAGRRLRLRLLTPPYSVLGVGTVRALRLHDDGEVVEILAGYETYERP